MTIQNLITLLNDNPYYILSYFFILFLIAIYSNIVVSPKNISQIKYVMSGLIYLVAIPGMLSVLLLLYNVLFLSTNILTLSLVSYFVPIVAMTATIIIINKKVKMAKLPGFTKLTSLFVMIILSFGILYILKRSFFGVIILGSFTNLILVFVGVLIILRFCLYKLGK